MLRGTLILNHLQYVSRSNVHVTQTVIRAMSADRHFLNDLHPLLADDHEGHLALVREILKAAAVALKEVKSAAVAYRDVSGGSLYVGVGGVGLTYLRMAQQLQRGFRFAHGSYLKKHDVTRCLQLAAQFLDDAETLMTSKRVSFLEGSSGVLAAQACLAHMTGQQDKVTSKLKAVEAVWTSHIQGVLPAGECELLYGRAGYLYSLAWLQQQIGEEVVSKSLIKVVLKHILDEGLRGAQQLRQDSLAGHVHNTAGSSSSSSSGDWGLMYKWHDKRYLGAAHGICGILYLLLHYMALVQELDAETGTSSSSSSSSSSSTSYEAAVRKSVDALAAAALPAGNLPTKLGDTQDVRVAWCHGAAGLVITLKKAAAVMGDDGGRYSRPAAAAARDIWARGLLKKGVGLCHGISGNGYALLSMARQCPDPQQQQQWLAAAQAFGVFAAQHWQDLYDTPDRPASLFEGLAGAVNFWLDVVEHNPQQRWPGAEL